MLYYQRSFLFPSRRIFLIFHPLEIKALKELAVDQKGAPPKRGSLGKGRIAQEGREADNPSLGRLCDPWGVTVDTRKSSCTVPDD